MNVDAFIVFLLVTAGSFTGVFLADFVVEYLLVKYFSKEGDKNE